MLIKKATPFGVAFLLNRLKGLIFHLLGFVNL